MKVLRVGSIEVVECIHCQGTGICKEAVHLPGTVKQITFRTMNVQNVGEVL